MIGYSRRPQARYRLERQGISTFLLWLLWRKIGVKSGWARKKIFVHIEIFRLGSVDRWCFWIVTNLWNWKSCTFPFCLATISGPHVGVPWGGWTLVTRPDRYCPPEESTFHDPPENKARTVLWTLFLSSQQHPLVVSVSDPYRAFCADMVPWWRVRCHFDTTLHCSIEDMLY